MPRERSTNEARLKDSLGMSKARTKWSKGIPPKGGIELLDSIERDRVTLTTSTPLYENASRLQPTSSNGARVLTWITR